MKTVVLTESQAKNLVSKFIGEQVPAMRALEYSMSDGRYHMKCEFDFQYDTGDYLVYKGGYIDSMDYGYGDVSFMLEIDHQPYGIRGIKVRDIRGPKEIETTIEFAPPGVKYEDDDYFDKRLKEKTIIPLNWRNVKIENDGAEYHDMNYYGVYKEIDVKLEPDGKGGLQGGRMEIIINETEKITD